RVERALGRLRSVVILHLNVEVLRPEDVLIPARRRPRAVQVATQQQLGYLAGKAAGGDDQSLGVPLQNLLVDTRTIVIATGVGDGRQLEQVGVARAILRQQQQVIVVVATCLLFEGGSQVGLLTNNGLDPRTFGALVEIERAVHATVVGERQRVHPTGQRRGDQAVEPGLAVEQAVLGV